jgi:antibiotic biosynthesis monooxygenase (ABM) superfamily enzyme
VPAVVLEHALLTVRPGEQEAFEAAFAQARTIIAAMPGFRGSAEYGEWRALLHSFYDRFPVVEHFATVLTG